MNVPAIHYNTPKDDGKTRCGRKLAAVKWRTDAKDVTCGNCERLIKHDAGR